jgi:hypothetical protein
LIRIKTKNERKIRKVLIKYKMHYLKAGRDKLYVKRERRRKDSATNGSDITQQI